MATEIGNIAGTANAADQTLRQNAELWRLTLAADSIIAAAFAAPGLALRA